MNDRGKRDVRERRLFVQYLILLVFVGIVGSVVVRVWTNRRRSGRLMEAARADGYPTSFAELAEYTKLPEGVPNAADVYARAFAAYVPPAEDANLPILGKAEMPGRKEPMPAPMARAVSEFLSANQDCLTLLREAGQIEYCRYDWDYADWDQSFLHSDNIKLHARLLRLAIAFHALEGDADSTLEQIKVGLQFGESLRREPGTICYLLRLACHGMALASLETALNATTFSDHHLTELSDALDAVTDALDFSRVMITARCFNLELCREPLRMAESQRLGFLANFWIDQALTDVLVYGSDYIEVARLPMHQRLGRVLAIDRALEDLPFHSHALTPLVAPVMNRITELDLRMRAHLNLAQAALAIERYRLAKGNVPAELATLVPEHLGAVPIDPFDGQPIRYRRTEPGYLLYSIMEDGQDNGGRTRKEVDRGEPYDLCFIVTR